MEVKFQVVLYELNYVVAYWNYQDETKARNCYNFVKMGLHEKPRYRVELIKFNKTGEEIIK